MIHNILILDGHRFTRKSDRRYHFVITGKKDLVLAARRSEIPCSVDMENAAYYTRLVLGTHDHCTFSRDDGKPGTFQDQVVEAGWSTSYEENLARIMREKKALLERKVHEGEFDLADLRWSMSEAAARKAIQQFAKWGFTELAIHPVSEYKEVKHRKETAA